MRTADWQFGAGAGAALSSGELRIEKSENTGKVRTVHRDGAHILSLRAGDGFWTLKAAGAVLLHQALPAPANRVVVKADSVPFNRAGKSVFSQFVVACDPALRPGDECLVVDEQDTLVAVGQVLLNAEEMADFQKGMAVKVREGIPA
ncbi:MAG: pseudouridine synthase [Halobacteriales archaeon]|nr:pseudouridine synthase [Halobacteriales archaeon]